jgi:hypothetical protein
MKRRKDHASASGPVEDEGRGSLGRLEVVEQEKRSRATLREIASLVGHVHDIRFSRPGQLPSEVPVQEKRRLGELLYESLLVEDRPELKRSVVRRMADKFGQYLLWSRISSTPVIHEFAALLPWWISRMPGSAVTSLRDIGLSYVLNGVVMPLQIVWKEVLEARLVYLGHCVCRSSGIAHDLYREGEVFTLGSSAEKRRLLDRFMARYRALKAGGQVAEIDPRYGLLFEELEALRKSRSPRYRLETLIASLHPGWEILPVHENYTPDWIRSMHANGKAHLLHKELVFELATILYLARGVIFTSMKLLDTPYTICSCPTPENGGGCVLTNWYYWGMSNASLVPNELAHGRRKDEAGNVLPCRFFPGRKERECVGCGCNHGNAAPREPRVILSEADRVLRRYRRKSVPRQRP